MFKNSLLLLLFSIAWLFGHPQQILPVLQSDSTSVIIKIDGKSFAIWNIDPSTKPGTVPDVFMIERSFNDHTVVYQSNRDSLVFTLKPGQQHDFEIHVRDRGVFPIRLATYGEPVFQHRIFIVLIILIISIVVCRLIPSLWLGIITPVLFWLMTFTGGFIHGGYNHLHMTVSELGTIGIRSEIFMSTAEMMVSVISVFSVIGFYKACRQIGINSIPVWTMLSLSLSMFWAAIFPKHHELHGALGPIPMLIIIGALLAVFLWKGKKFGNLRLVSFISFLVMSLLLLRFIPDLQSHWEGLIQRLYYLGWSLWSVGLSLIFIRMAETRNK